MHLIMMILVCDVILEIVYKIMAMENVFLIKVLQIDGGINVDNYFFISSGSHDDFGYDGILFGDSMDLKGIMKEFAKMDMELIRLRDLWEHNDNLETYKEWRDTCDNYKDMIGKLAKNYGCKYFKTKRGFHFEGLDI